MDQIPPPPPGTPEGHAVIHRDITPIVDIWRKYAIDAEETNEPRRRTVTA